MECRLARSPPGQPWKCKVSLRFEFDEETGRTKDKVKEQRFGDIITDPDGVEIAIRRAQAAILNPRTSSKQFLTLSEETLRTEKSYGGTRSLDFSRNVVCLDISGPEVLDLAFVDLPGRSSIGMPRLKMTPSHHFPTGLIQNAEPALVKKVEDLVVSHIEGNCIILVALPMSGKFCRQRIG